MRPFAERRTGHERTSGDATPDQLPARAGFAVLHLAGYVNPWIAEHRYQDQVRLTDLEGRPVDADRGPSSYPADAFQTDGRGFCDHAAKASAPLILNANRYTLDCQRR